jgi:hypothetical protein
LIKNASNYGFYVHGELDMMPESAVNAATPGVALDYSYSTSAPTDGIILSSGGKFQLETATNTSPIINGITIGTSAHRPTVGILDNGGSGFFTMGTGSNTIYATSAGKCWQGSNTTNLFSDTAGIYSSNAGKAGDTTSTTTTTFPNGWYRLYNNSANLTCAQS